MRIRGDDRGAIGVPGIVKLAAALAVLGLLGYDGFVTIATHLKAEDDAQNAAYAASQAWIDAPAAQRTAMSAYQAAAEWTAENNASDHVCEGSTDPLCGDKGSFSIDPDGTVHLVIRREAKTLIFKHLGFMHGLLVAYESGDANSNN
ncbi:MAG TPA: hypothetical protein VHE57_00630 [Mycobacteriales bacterium]|jgi:hypothetical protein|nr:hypothetical protein [Mycobacteriales bacterium]